MSGFFEIVKIYPLLVVEGFRLSMDKPITPKLRIDPDREKKAREKQEQQEKWHEEIRASGYEDFLSPSTSEHRMPPLKTIHLQWHDREYDKWIDTRIRINLEDKTLEQYDSWILGHQHEGSGAIGVILFASPFLLLGSPYIMARNSIYSRSEEKEKMSRHAIALMKALRGQLDTDTESLLRTALQNKFALGKILRQCPTFEETCALLDCCTLETEIKEWESHESTLYGFKWFDTENNLIAHATYESKENGYCYVRIFSAQFTGDEAKELMQRFGKLPQE